MIRIKIVDRDLGHREVTCKTAPQALAVLKEYAQTHDIYVDFQYRPFHEITEAEIQGAKEITLVVPLQAG